MTEVTHAPAADAAHLCSHSADTLGTEGCPRWPSCLTPDVLRPMWAEHALTEAEAGLLHRRYRDATDEMRLNRRVDGIIDGLRAQRHAALMARELPHYRGHHRAPRRDGVWDHARRLLLPGRTS